MRTGTLRHLVSLQNPVAGSPPVNAIGEPDEPWTSFATNVPASFEPLTGRELIAAQATQAETTGKIRIRYAASYVGVLTAKSRVLFGTRTFDITAPPINIKERNWELLLLVKEGPNNG